MSVQILRGQLEKEVKTLNRYKEKVEFQKALVTSYNEMIKAAENADVAKPKVG